MAKALLQSVSVPTRFRTTEIRESIVRYVLNILLGPTTENILSHPWIRGEPPLPPKYPPRSDR